MKPTMVRFILLGRYMFSLNQQLQKLCRSVGEMHTQWQKKWCSNALNVFAHIHFLLKYRKKNFWLLQLPPHYDLMIYYAFKMFPLHWREPALNLIHISKVYSDFELLSEWHFVMENRFYASNISLLLNQTSLKSGIL